MEFLTGQTDTNPYTTGVFINESEANETHGCIHDAKVIFISAMLAITFNCQSVDASYSYHETTVHTSSSSCLDMYSDASTSTYTGYADQKAKAGAMEMVAKEYGLITHQNIPIIQRGIPMNAMDFAKVSIQRYDHEMKQAAYEEGKQLDEFIGGDVG